MKNNTAISARLLRYDTRCYFNVRSKADTRQLNLRTKTTTKSVKQKKIKKVKTDMLEVNSKQSGGIM